MTVNFGFEQKMKRFLCSTDKYAGESLPASGQSGGQDQTGRLSGLSDVCTE